MHNNSRFFLSLKEILLLLGIVYLEPLDYYCRWARLAGSRGILPHGCETYLNMQEQLSIKYLKQ